MSTRRDFLAQLAAAAPLSAYAGRAAADLPLSVGLEIYSLRREMAQDIPGTLARIRTLGFNDVEVPGFYGLTPEGFRKALDAAGLKASALVAQWDELNKDMGVVTAALATLGAQWLVLPWLPHGKTFTRTDADTAARAMNIWGAALAKGGYRFAYHPHGYEFQPSAEGTLFDMLVNATDPDTVHLEMDTFWIAWPGQDCVRLLDRYPRRFRLFHLKDLRKGAGPGNLTGMAPEEDSVAVGEGSIPWRAVLAAAKRAGVERYYIEDESPASAQQIPRSLRYLEGLAR